MGRAPGKQKRLDGEVPLFADEETRSEKRPGNLPLDTPALRQAAAENAPAQTDAKSRLIAEYLSRFQLVTKGGLYIDGFAAPQKRDRPDAWTARRVLEITPPRIRTFWLCDMDPEGCEQLKGLKAKHNGVPASRKIFVFQGDFNKRVDEILVSGRIKRRSAVFALLDQRNTECEWSTVQKLAAYKGRTRIEILYFLGTSWLFRTLKVTKSPERLAQIDRWWGSPNWRELVDMDQTSLAVEVAQRFQKELGYKFSNEWPIYLKDEGKKKAFVLIHATDHPAARNLMRAAYASIYGDKPGSPTDAQKPLFGPDPLPLQRKSLAPGPADGNGPEKA